MAKKTSAEKVAEKVAEKPADGKAAEKSPARKAAARQREVTREPREVTHEMIAERAYELYMRGVPGSPDDHWHLAENELRGHGG